MAVPLSKTMTNSVQTEEAIRRQLLESIGVHPSQEWLRACLLHLQSTPLHNNNVIDEVLNQLLHADLRDVVRGNSTTTNASAMQNGFQTAAVALSGNASSSSSSMSSPVAVQQLHQALQLSQQPQHSYKQTLPATFHLLCQVEEVCDASLPAEKRLEVAVQHQQQQQQNNHPAAANRCLKLCLTDGYHHPTANSSSSNSSNTTLTSYIILGVEIQAPIPNLSATSPAGRKVLLKGPLDVRHGQLLLTPASGIVLGGHVDALVAQQQQALQKAKQAAGVGIDPTIRALIGTGVEDGDDNDTDEANEASGDVLPSQSAAAPAPLAPVIQPINVVAQSTMSRNTSVMPPPSSSQAPRQARSAWGTAHCTNTTTSTHNNQQPSQQQSPHNPQEPHQLQQQQPTSQPCGTTPLAETVTKRPAVNPYATGGSTSLSSATSASATTSSNPYVQRPMIRTAAQASNNPYQNVETIAPILTPARATTSNGYQSTATAAVTTISHPPMPNPNKSTTTTIAAAASTNVMSLSSLYRLLTTLMQNREMYESYCQQQLSFRVQLTKASTGPVTFNVIKNKNHCKKDPTSQKYEFFIALFFVGNEQQSQNNNKVCCRIHPSLVAPQFEVSAADLRAMTRTDRKRSQQIIDQGGENVARHYFCHCTWTASLYLPASEIFQEEHHTAIERLTNMNHPILMLRDPERI